jgi:hypothetical protein
MLRVLVAVIPLVVASLPAAAAEENIGTVRRIQAEVDALRAAEVFPLVVESRLRMEDLLRSGEDARLEAELVDGTKLTLGEQAELRLDRYVYDPNNAARNRLVAKIKGAFLFIGGKVEGPGSEVTIVTTNAVMGVRGTTFWGGPIDNAYGVLALAGIVTVTTNAGSVTLTEGQGTMIVGASTPPEQPKVWPDQKRNRAIATITFQ